MTNYPQRHRDNAKGTTPTRDMNAFQRVQMALELKAQGKTYDEIAALAGYGSRGAAHKAIMREMQRNISPKVEDMRREELNTMETLNKELWKIFLNAKVYPRDRVQAAHTILSISERKARMFGLDTPTDQAANQNVVLIREIPQGLLDAVEQGA